MKALLAGLLATTLVVTGCTSVPPSEKSAARKPKVSTVVPKYVKSLKSRKTKPVAKARYTDTTTGSRAQPQRADPVTEKAKGAVAGMLEDPASAEFYNLKRAQRKLLSKNRDTICGYVKAKTGPDGNTRDMPFLYTVDDGEAYLVNGSHVAETVHRALCK